ncbi:MAG: hypothetical protein ACYDCF_09215 [Burkholderiales bacterium]
MSDRHPKNTADPSPKKSPIFFTLQPEKRIAKWFLGASSIKRTGGVVRRFQDTMLHGDAQYREWMDDAPIEERELLAKRVRREGLIYGGMGLLFSMASFGDGITHGLHGQLSTGMFWLFMGLLSGILGGWLATVKFWQAYNVRHAEHVGLRAFLMIGPRSKNNTNNS